MTAVESCDGKNSAVNFYLEGSSIYAIGNKFNTGNSDGRIITVEVSNGLANYIGSFLALGISIYTRSVAYYYADRLCYATNFRILTHMRAGRFDI